MTTTDRQFRFQSAELPLGGVEVVHFRAHERLGHPFEYVITLLVENPKIDLDSFLQHPATLGIFREQEWIPVHGVIAAIEQLHEVRTHGEAGGQALYRVTLVPRLWNLSLATNNRVFLDASVPQIIERVLADHQLTSVDCEFRLGGTYAPLEFVCQYQETDLAFVQRWAEREGIYFFFEHEADCERIIFVDDFSVHRDYAQDPTMWYRRDDDTGHTPGDYDLVNFVGKQSPVPHEVILKTYSYRNAQIENLVRATVSSAGRGAQYIYGERFDTPAEGQRLAEIRAQQMLCTKQQFFGESRNTGLHPGLTFFLRRHYRPNFNRKYLVTEIEHEGHQFSALGTIVAESLGMDAVVPGYMNRFTAIPDDVQYRPPRLAPWPRISGTLSGHVIATGSEQWADMDEQGRYKVRLPFDISGSPDQQASHWIRKAQPSGGDGTGTNFPLPPHTEVLLNFIDGDPDRPEIIGTVTNSTDESIITAATQRRSGIRSTGGNQIAMEDTPGHEHVGMISGGGNSRFIMGSGSADRVELNSDWGAMSAKTAGGLSAGITNTLLSGMSASLSAGFIGKQIVEQVLKTIESTFLSFWADKLTENRADPAKAQRDLDSAIEKEAEKKAEYDATAGAAARTVLESKRTALDTKKAERDAKKAEEDEAKQTWDDAVAAQQTKEQALTDAQTAENDAQAELTAAQTAEAAAQTAMNADPSNQALQDAYNDAVAERQDKQQAHTTAITARQAAQSELTAAQAAANSAEADYNTKKAAREALDTQVATAETEYNAAVTDFASKDAAAREKEAAYYSAVAARKKAESDKEKADSGYNKIGKPILMVALPVVQALLMFAFGKLNSKITAKMGGSKPDLESSDVYLGTYQDVAQKFAQTMAEGNAAGLMQGELGVSLSLDATKKNIAFGTLTGSIVTYSEKDIFFVAQSHIHTMTEKWWMTVADAGPGRFLWVATPKSQTAQFSDKSKVSHAPKEFFAQIANGQIGIIKDGSDAHAQIAARGVYLCTKAHTETTKVELHAKQSAGTILLAATDSPGSDEPGSGTRIKMGEDGKLNLFASDALALKAKKPVTLDAKDITITGTNSITLKVGNTTIEIKSAGITITTSKLEVTSTGDLKMTGNKVEVAGGNMVRFLGADIKIL